MRDLGDWQTPREVAVDAVGVLKRLGVSLERVLEPTCGSGAFVDAVEASASEVIGIDIQSTYVDSLSARYAGHPSVQVFQGDIFTVDVGSLEWTTHGSLVILGNPPWVTNSELSRLSSSNVPQKSNLKSLTGLDAMTGAANFDIAEYIVLKCLSDTSGSARSVAMLVKTSVARKVLEYAFAHDWTINRASLHRFDTKSTFGASVDACLFVLSIDSPDSPTVTSAAVYDSFAATTPVSRIGYSGSELVADIDLYRKAAFADGASHIEWRQGLKHDAARIMELSRDESGNLANGLGESVDIEAKHVYPLLKSTDLARGREVSRYVIVPQTRIGESTDHLADDAPKLWAYLDSHGDALAARKSSIYRNRSRFSIFGIGEYSFSRYKVAISGLHKEPVFRPVPPLNGKPVMFDDTCYLIPATSLDQAQLMASILNSDACRGLLNAMVFTDAKRPITKKLLQRVDQVALLEAISDTELRLAAEVTVGHAPDWLDLPRLDLVAVLVDSSSSVHESAQQSLLFEILA